MLKKEKPYEIGELDQYLFGQGNHYEIYEKLGAHLVQNGKQKRSLFCSVGTACAGGIGSRRVQ